MELGSSEPHNLGVARISSHRWSGIEVHAVQQEVLPGQAWQLLKSTRPMLSVVVNEVGGWCETRPDIRERIPLPIRQRRRGIGHASLIPGGLGVWGYSDAIARVDSVRLILDVDRVSDVMGGEFPANRLDEPRLMVIDESLQSMASALASSQEDMPCFELFCDSLVVAMIAQLARVGPARNPADRRLGLSARQRTDVTAFMLENLAEPVRLAELASLAGLSPSQFGRAFKISTGTTPHKWHLDARIDYAKRMLGDRKKSLVDVALDAGFSEQSHFTRAFRAATGASPGAWRKTRLK